MPASRDILPDNVQTVFDQLVNTPEERKLFQRERTIMEITEMLCRVMKEQNVSRAELADRLGMSKGSISQMLSGGRNLTVKSISDILFALNRSLVARVRGIEEQPYKDIANTSIAGRIGWSPATTRPTIKIEPPGDMAA